MFKKLNYFLCFLQLLVTEILHTLASKVANSHTLFSLTLFIFYLDSLILHHYILLKWNSLKLEFQLSSFCFLNFSFLLHWQGGKFANKFSTAILIFTFGGMYFTALALNLLTDFNENIHPIWKQLTKTNWLNKKS